MDVTELLLRWSRGDKAALQQLTPMVYDELLRLAKIKLSGEVADLTLQPTALVHEAYLKLMDHTRLSWRPAPQLTGLVVSFPRLAG